MHLFGRGGGFFAANSSPDVPGVDRRSRDERAVRAAVAHTRTSPREGVRGPGVARAAAAHATTTRHEGASQAGNDSFAPGFIASSVKAMGSVLPVAPPVSSSSMNRAMLLEDDAAAAADRANARASAGDVTTTRPAAERGSDGGGGAGSARPLAAAEGSNVAKPITSPEAAAARPASTAAWNICIRHAGGSSSRDENRRRIEDLEIVVRGTVT